MEFDGLKEQLKKVIVEELNLEDIDPGEIDDNAPLFGEGLELDSLDAVELVVQLQTHFGVEITSMEQAKPVFQSIETLARFIQENQG
ncbi:MAG: acyl carrier protein [Desulfobacterium sp.]|nr:acyl carrier protein [Desulfobacterium sp.]